VIVTVKEGVVLCGPPCAGKTVSGRLVADALGWSFVDADVGQASWLVERGWGGDSFGRRVSEVGRHRAYLEYEVLMADYLSAVLAEHPAGVIALGAGHAHATGSETAKRMVGTLRDEPRSVVRLLPEPDSAVSLAAVDARSVP
jgi:shikimate kinase